MLAILVALALSAPTHQAGISRGTWSLDGRSVDAELVWQRDEAAAIAAHLPGAIVVTVDGAACPGEGLGDQAVEEDGHAWRLRFTCPHEGRVTVELGALFPRLSAGHRHLGRAITPHGATDVMAAAGASSFSFGERTSVAAYLGIGVEHILFGFDHLVFLFGLILVGGRLRSLLAVVTAFTLAHSVTLACAVLGLWAPPSALVEPLIALSIAYVGVENFFVTDAARRWRITAPFGLIHGFGFAGALSEVGIPRDEAPTVLLLFNLGVELGQLLVLAPVLPVLALLRWRGWLGPRAMRGLSLVVVALGLFWLVERVLGLVADAGG
ncbi:MAG: HupE/UreJ family protein [Deltaproteobacteria bacterium]|nr:HupE/UreJ family protein [Deltaproteobacteria bacterium]